MSSCLPGIGYTGRLLSGGLVLLVSFVCGTASADEPDRNWIFSGSELVQALKGDLAPEVSDPELRRMLSSARGNAYIAGVADRTSGSEWCAAGSVLPHEITDRVFTYLGELPPERLTESAAKLASEALAVSFPCGPHAQ